MNHIELPLASRTELKTQYQRHHEGFRRTLERFEAHLRQTLGTLPLSPTIKTRVKSFDSLYGKLVTRSRTTASDAVSIPDLFGVRVVCPFLEDLSRVETVLQKAMDVREIERKGAEFSSSEFGYESTHLLVTIPEQSRIEGEVGADPVCEIQLRTILQDAWAEVEHELVYKADNAPFEEQLKRKLAALNANLTLADIIFQEIRDYHRSLHAELFKRRRQFWSQLQRVSGLPSERSAPPETLRSERALGTPDLMDSSRLAAAADPTEAQLLSALQAHNRHDFSRAVELYTAILDSDIKPYLRAIVLIHRGMAYFAISDYDRAIGDFSGALELDDDNWKAYYYRGMVYRLQGAYGQALADLNRCVELDVSRFDSRFARAQVYFDKGDYQKALSDCNAALELEPDSTEARRFRRVIEDRLLAQSGNWSG
jgi:putative GTP pyrophosphokinase